MKLGLHGHSFITVTEITKINKMLLQLSLGNVWGFVVCGLLLFVGLGFLTASLAFFCIALKCCFHTCIKIYLEFTFLRRNLKVASLPSECKHDNNFEVISSSHLLRLVTLPSFLPISTEVTPHSFLPSQRLKLLQQFLLRSFKSAKLSAN